MNNTPLTNRLTNTRRPARLAAIALTWGAWGMGGCAGGDAAPPRLYVTSGLTDQIFVLDARDGSVLDSLSVDRRPAEADEPHGIAISPDGGHWYTTVAHGEPTLWKFESNGDRLVGRLTLEQPGAARIGITPDGRRAFVPDYWRSGQGAESNVTVVGLEDLSVTRVLTVCPAPHDARVSPNGAWVAITCSLSDEVVLLDAHTLEVAARFPVGAQPGPPGAPVYKPLNAAWSPDGGRIYVTLHLAAEVRSYRLDGMPVAAVATGAGPTQLELTPDGATLVVANRGDASISLVSTDRMVERLRVPLEGADHPHGIALDGGSTAFVSYEGTVEGYGGAVAVRISDGTVLWRTEAGVYTLGVAYLGN